MICSFALTRLFVQAKQQFGLDQIESDICRTNTCEALAKVKLTLRINLNSAQRCKPSDRCMIQRGTDALWGNRKSIQNIGRASNQKVNPLNKLAK